MWPIDFEDFFENYCCKLVREMNEKQDESKTIIVSDNIKIQEKWPSSDVKFERPRSDVSSYLDKALCPKDV